MLSLSKLSALNLFQKIPKFLSFLASALIIGLRPILGPACCKFEPTCTKYAIKCLAEQPFHKAIWAIIKRLLSCNPFF